MSYQTYTTEAIVCGTFNRNTADRSYLLFTREAGMLYAEARSAREERSRQRFALQDFSYVRSSLIKGKSSWKIGSIEPQKNFFMTANSKEARGSVVTVTRFMRRFYSGQEPAPQVFDYVHQALLLLSGEVKDRTQIEQVVMVRLLLELGYVDPKMVPLVVHHELGLLTTSGIRDEESKKLQPLIDKAVTLSQL